MNLNTSYVTVNHRNRDAPIPIFINLNTSYVTVNPTKNTSF